ncbi:hypothetical protein LTR36_006218 [Oleoguttula mirabilis]|uniref:Uncharacterized protein n=1 Tax=Oleoguttula mirabilis TaxID=1507867 RepID=A0AAV9JBX0_9PEZI|nr:hypothetical protein LTR36_006218 [Oleoguttula mirabilis]
MSARGDPVDDRAIWNEKINAIADFETYVQRLTEVLSPSADPLQRYTALCARQILHAMRILLHRPIYKSSICRPPPDDNFDVMEAATLLMENGLDKEDTTGSDRWFWYKWTPWYALAIVLAELCSRPWDPATDHSWSVAQICYSQCAQQVADGDTGMLWKPIARLMRRVKDIRAPAAAETAANLQQMSIHQYAYPEEAFSLLAAYQGTPAANPDLPPIAQPPYTLGYGPGGVLNANIDQALLQDQDFSQLATSGLLDTSEGMSWFNWENFMDDVSSYGNM